MPKTKPARIKTPTIPKKISKRKVKTINKTPYGLSESDNEVILVQLDEEPLDAIAKEDEEKKEILTLTSGEKYNALDDGLSAHNGTISFESALPVIDEELVKRRSRWRLTAIAWMDYDDVSQKIRLHLFKKWDQWDQQRPLRRWVNKIISNQMTNLVRNYYSSFSKPCLDCKYNRGGDLCELYGKQCGSCPIFSKWEKTKKDAHSVKLPLSLNDKGFQKECGESAIHDIKDSYSFCDFETAVPAFHLKIKKKLSNIEWRIYSYIYIDHLDEVEAARKMGYKTNERNRSPGYKQIKKIKNKIYKIARALITEG